MKVSTIVPVYNREKMVVEAVESVLSQTYRPIEIVLVDDGSTDQTWKVLCDLQRRFPDIVVVARQENGGPGVARNTGLQLASGEYVQYLDSDDLLYAEKFSRQVDALKRNPDAGVCYCTTLRRNPTSGEVVPWARTAERIHDIFPSFLPKRGWATLTPLWRRTVCDAIGPWKPFRVMEDWEHDLRAGILGVKAVHVPEALCFVRDHDQGRASGMTEGFTRDRVLDFFRAHESVWKTMEERGLVDWDYLRQFSRTMFWIARTCGSQRLWSEAELGLNYADEMAIAAGAVPFTRQFRLLRAVFGWRGAVAVVETAAKIRRSVEWQRS